MPSGPGAVFGLNFLMVLCMSFLVKVPLARSGSGYAVIGIIGKVGGGGRKVSASTLALSTLLTMVDGLLSVGSRV